MHVFRHLPVRLGQHRSGALRRRAVAGTAARRLPQRLRSGLLIAFLLLGLALSTNSASVAHAASTAGGAPSAQWLGRHVMLGLSHQAATGTTASPTNASCVGNCGTPPLYNPNNNPVQHDPRVYTVFWGSKWNSDTNNVRPTVNGLLQHLAGGQYNNILAQYTDGVGAPNNFIHNDVAWDGDWVDTAIVNAPLTSADLENEALKALQANNWIADPNTQVMIFPEQSTVYDPATFTGECAEHDATRASNGATITYSLIMYGDDPNCAFAGDGSKNPTYIAANMTHGVAHEYAEAATDPGLSSWKTSDGKEIADICNADNESYTPTDGSGITYFVLDLWSNNQSGCVSSLGAEYASPDMVYPFDGMHTVHGAIWGVYTANGGSSGVLHAPVTEETPIGNGRVSYFNDTCGGTTRCAGIYWSPSTGTYIVRAANFSEYQQVGDAGGAVGFPVSPESTMGSGVVQYFNANCGGTVQCAGIYWSSGTGSHLVRGADFSYYQSQGQATGVLGFPVDDESPMHGGGAQHFAAGAGLYYSSGPGTVMVRAADYSDYRSLQEANGPLGFPLGGEAAISGGSAQYFTANQACGTPGPSGSDGAIYYSSGTGSHAVYGCIYAFYVANGATGGPLGYPVYDEQGITDRYGNSGRVSYFTGNHGCGSPGPYGSDGAIYWTGSAAFESYGCIYGTYITYGGGGPGGPLGFPTSNEYTNSLGQPEQVFANGTITWVNGQGQVCLGTTC